MFLRTLVVVMPGAGDAKIEFTLIYLVYLAHDTE